MKLRVKDEVTYIAADQVYTGTITYISGVQFNIVRHPGRAYTDVGIHKTFIFSSEKEAYTKLLQRVEHAISQLNHEAYQIRETLRKLGATEMEL